MIELNNVCKQYSTANIIKNFNLKIEESGIYCLLGRNGAGKTTLLKSIAGYQNITSGSIMINGKQITIDNMETSVSYIDNFAKHFNLPVKKLIQIAYELDYSFDYEFAMEMVDRFELDENKKFKKLSLGMKTMISTIICLASNKDVVLLDEPVLGFDAIMRAEFYDLLLESFERHPRIIIVSTHIIDEISNTIHKLIIIDKGSLKFYDDVNVIDEYAYSVSGLQKDVEAVSTSLNVIGEIKAGGYTTKYIFDKRIKPTDNVTVRPLSLQEFFVQLVDKRGGKK
ncbi:ATP-binding cassette domain-containing protein [Clostridioides difficile]|uniref:ATP-binding cassette domain-containing protein n=1 Tax=Clostridioides difficile TaxID=1496 RepID=UPI003F8D32D1